MNVLGKVKERLRSRSRPRNAAGKQNIVHDPMPSNPLTGYRNGAVDVPASTSMTKILQSPLVGTTAAISKEPVPDRSSSLKQKPRPGTSANESSARHRYSSSQGTGFMQDGGTQNRQYMQTQDEDEGMPSPIIPFGPRGQVAQRSPTLPRPISRGTPQHRYTASQGTTTSVKSIAEPVPDRKSSKVARRKHVSGDAGDGQRRRQANDAIATEYPRVSQEEQRGRAKNHQFSQSVDVTPRGLAIAGTQMRKPSPRAVDVAPNDPSPMVPRIPKPPSPRSVDIAPNDPSPLVPRLPMPSNSRAVDVAPNDPMPMVPRYTKSSDSDYASSAPPPIMPRAQRPPSSREVNGDGLSAPSPVVQRIQKRPSARSVDVAPNDPSPLIPRSQKTEQSVTGRVTQPERPTGPAKQTAKRFPVTDPKDLPEHLRLPPGFRLGSSETTEVTEDWRPAVTREQIFRERVEIIQEVITRDIHVHHYYTYLQPVKVVEILPARHFRLDEETGQKIEIAAPPGWRMPEVLKPTKPDITGLAAIQRHYLVNEKHPKGILEPPPRSR